MLTSTKPGITSTKCISMYRRDLFSEGVAQLEIVILANCRRCWILDAADLRAVIGIGQDRTAILVIVVVSYVWMRQNLPIVIGIERDPCHCRRFWSGRATNPKVIRIKQHGTTIPNCHRFLRLDTPKLPTVIGIEQDRNAILVNVVVIRG